MAVIYGEGEGGTKGKWEGRQGEMGRGVHDVDCWIAI